MIEPETILTDVNKLLQEADYALNIREFDKARTSAERAIQLAREKDHTESMAAAYYAMAAVIWGSGGESSEAHRYAALAADNSKPNTQTDLLVRTLVARLKVARGNFSAARALNEDLLDFYTQSNDLRGQADILRSMGDLHAAQEQYNRAEERYRQSLRLFESLDDPLNHAGLLLSLGSLKYRVAERGEARECWQKARELARSHGFRHIIDAAEEGLNLPD